MSGPDQLFAAPRPVRLARACLWVQALILLVPLMTLIQYVRWGSGELTGTVIIVLVVQTAAILGLSTLGLLVAGVGATQLLTEPAQDWFHLRGRERL
ncbi:hypothetical protein [Nonomuraea sp. NPDC003709]|uniref:hypothetical protein n=1 Tax=Nonomuraea sp. NPDC003709 TaxID=3154450 RepID=UPI0033B2076E